MSAEPLRPAGSAVTIRPRQPADLAACAAILAEVHAVDHYPTRWPADPTAWLSPRGLLGAWVASSADIVIGHVGLVPVADPAEPHVLAATGRSRSRLASISRLFVGASARGTGAGAALLSTAATAAVERDLQPVLDVVTESASAIALYERQGWQRVAVGPAHWRNAAGEHPNVAYYIKPR